MKLLLVISPILALALMIAVQLLRKRRLARNTTSVLVSLLLLLYLAATSVLGIFWVAEMALPKFELHYLFGYCVMFLAAAHVALQVRPLSSFFRNHSPRILLTKDGRRFRAGFRMALWIGMVVLIATPLLPLLLRQTSPMTKIVERPSSTGIASQRRGLPKDQPEVWIEAGGTRQTVIDYLYQQASRPRARPLSRALHALHLRRLPTTPAPPSCKSYPERRSLSLPQPRQVTGTTLRDALDRAPLGAMLWEEKVDEHRSNDQASAANAKLMVDLTVATPEASQRDQSDSRAITVSLEDVADLLHYAYGVTRQDRAGSGTPLRAAASAGARYPIDVYLAVREARGLAPGVYYYHPIHHALVAVGGAQALDQIARSVSRPEEVLAAPVSVVLGATFDRTVSRYGAHSYRYIALDAGHVASNLGLAAEARGLHCSHEALFDDRALAAAVGVSSNAEGMLLVMSCDAQPKEASSPSSSHLTIPPYRMLPFPSDPDLVELTRLSDLMTSWILLPGASSVVPPPAVETSLSGQVVTLTESSGPNLQVFDAIRQRRSYRNFASGAVPQESFAGILQDALTLIPWMRGRQYLDLYVTVRAVEGIPAGIYRYESERRALLLVRSGNHSESIEEASLSQQVLGRAAFVLMWAMRTKVAERLDGTRGFRHAHLAAGMGGQNAYLSAVARRLGACGVGAFDDTRLNGLVDGKAPERLVLYMVGIGQTT